LQVGFESNKEVAIVLKSCPELKTDLVLPIQLLHRFTRLIQLSIQHLFLPSEFCSIVYVSCPEYSMPRGPQMLRFAFEYCNWLFQKIIQELHGLRLRYMVWLYPDEARAAAVRARWFGSRDNDTALLNGADIIERLLATRK
jgi:hypothetical protein